MQRLAAILCCPFCQNNWTPGNCKEILWSESASPECITVESGETVHSEILLHKKNRDEMSSAADTLRNILHICTRETIRPLRDQVLRLQGFQVDSALNHQEGLSMFWSRQYDLVLIDVEGESGIKHAEHMCAEIKTAQPEQTVAFVCNWRVANLTDCPDDIVRTEFDPAAFAAGVSSIVLRTA